MNVGVGNIVTVNTGSSSMKLALFSDDEQRRLVDISLEGIGQATASLRVILPDASSEPETVSAPDHEAASRVVMDALEQRVAAGSIRAIGYRLVHGGDLFTEPTLVASIRDADWDRLSELDAEHTPFARQNIGHFRDRYPDAAHVALFDTAFFNELPRVSKTLPLPQRYFEQGIRRYGFHGLSYTSLLETFRREAGDEAANGRVILAHLGSGASVSAVRFGKPVDTTMSLTPTSGIPMSTRSGDLDPHVFGQLHRLTGMSSEEFEHMTSFESGLLGVSGTSADMYTLLQRETEDENAALAIELFVRGVKKAIGSLAATLGGVDSLIFSGGIGERSVVLRERICADLEYMGVILDDAANQQARFLISSDQSRVGVHVIATDEARVIADQTLALINKNKQG